MSAMGHKRKWCHARVMSDLPLKADIRRREWHVRYVPIADSGAVVDQLAYPTPIEACAPAKISVRPILPLSKNGSALRWQSEAPTRQAGDPSPFPGIGATYVVRLGLDWRSTQTPRKVSHASSIVVQCRHRWC